MIRFAENLANPGLVVGMFQLSTCSIAIALGLQFVTPSYENSFNKTSFALAIIIFIIILSIYAYLILIIQ
jgi:hypothetical protein